MRRSASGIPTPLRGFYDKAKIFSRVVMNSPLVLSNASQYELRFRSLLQQGRDSCDSDGRVNMDAMSDHTRDSYLFARALVGLEVAHPHVQLAH